MAQITVTSSDDLVVIDGKRYKASDIAYYTPETKPNDWRFELRDDGRTVVITNRGKLRAYLAAIGNDGKVSVHACVGTLTTSAARQTEGDANNGMDLDVAKYHGE